MKAIVKTNTVIKDKQITITGELMDVPFPLVVGQRQSIGHQVPTNPHHPRRTCVTNHGFQIDRYGAEGFLFPIEEMVAVAIQADPKLADAPMIVATSDKAELKAHIISESDFQMEWQESNDGQNWTSMKADGDKFIKGDSKFHRCVAVNHVGQTVQPLKQ